MANRRNGKHRVASATPLRARTALVAVAAGAGVAAFSSSATIGDSATDTAAAEQPKATLAGLSSSVDTGPGTVAVSSEAEMDTYAKQLSSGRKLAADRAAKEAAKRRPLFASPVKLGAYQFTSGFANRWGSFHSGIDMAAPLGTPIHAATDGTVIAAGPASGFGNWIKLKAADGTITLYGHMASSGVLVHKGQKVTAGDVIALVGSEGFSTGPHLHFEVWRAGKMKIDPALWLAKHGVRVSAYTG